MTELAVAVGGKLSDGEVGLITPDSPPLPMLEVFHNENTCFGRLTSVVQDPQTPAGPCCVSRLRPLTDFPSETHISSALPPSGSLLSTPLKQAHISHHM